MSAKELDEISGIAVSCVLSDIVSVHNYEGDGNLLYVVDVNTAQLMTTFVMTIAHSFDWEDTAYCPCADDCKQNICKVSNGDYINAVWKSISEIPFIAAQAKAWHGCLMGRNFMSSLGAKIQ
ncbi:hypothetical protein PoB_007589200 [Plakobranchus ocellatus]|uniref:Uncharacterized protein n=1 Tax=Plakobranchus ocellatus TaxID=259542 RepID=A0AAV4DZC0_9GAST|nr:hypothetical protein PoB_007589200 [Plakobranchus ocellatus]